MKRVNFTTEHETKLKDLVVELLLAGVLVEGIAGVKYSIHDLLHNVTIQTLVLMFVNIKKSISKIENLDEWSMNDYQQTKLDEEKKMAELINLIIGWRKLQEQIERDKARIAEKKKELKIVKEQNLTPEERVKRLSDEIQALGGDATETDED